MARRTGVGLFRLFLRRGFIAHKTAEWEGIFACLRACVLVCRSGEGVPPVLPNNAARGRRLGQLLELFGDCWLLRRVQSRRVYVSSLIEPVGCRQVGTRSDKE